MTFFYKNPNLTVVISCIFWGTYWIPLRFIDNQNNSSVWPIAIGFLLLSIFVCKNIKKFFYNIINNQNYFFILGCLFAALGVGLYSESLLRGEIAKVVVLFYLAPIWGTIFAKIILKQSFSINRVISIILGIIGLEIIVGIEKGIFIPSSFAKVEETTFDSTSELTSFSSFKAFAPCVIVLAEDEEKLKEFEFPKFVKSEYPGFLFCIL